MDKNDFDSDEYNDKEPKHNFFFNPNNSSENSNQVFGAIDNGEFYSASTDTSQFDGTDNTISDANVVYEEKANMTFKEKIQNFIDNLNKTMVALIAGIILVILIVIGIIAISISRENHAYKVETIVPTIVYMGETSGVITDATYTGSDKTKKGMENLVTTFEIKNKDIISVVEDEVKGKDTINTIVPIQEGRTTIVVTSKIENKIISKTEKEVIVCPSFSTKVLLSDHVSVVKGLYHDLNIDFGEPECGSGVTYTSSNPSIAEIDSEGKITANEEGQAIVTIAKDTKYMTVNVYVTPKYVSMTSFTVVPTTLQLSKGEKYRLRLDYQPAMATSFTPKFSSENEEIATVSKGGLIEALKEGTTTIKVSAPSNNFKNEVKVVVTKKDAEGDFPTALNLDKSTVALVEGQSEKITATITPQSVSNKTITWKSSDTEIATVDKNGIIYGKNQGVAQITATTKNGISKTVQVKVEKMKTPTITTSDGVASNVWHLKPYILRFSSPESGIVYYYGKSENEMKQIESQITITKDESETYYVKACKRSCMDVCVDKKDKKGVIEKDQDGNPIKTCTSKCSKKPSICSDSATYISKLDITKPKVVTIAGIENTPVKTDIVQIALNDDTSLVQKWCVTTKNSFATCKWGTIQTSANPVVNYTATKNGIYYVFAKDAAGNISDSLSFEITNIE